MSTQAIAREIQDKRLIAVDIEGFRAVRDLYLITDPQRLPTRVARAFLEFLGDWRRSADGQATARPR
ncbi:MAG TPA: LysR substrate-binding domain-containing protein [Pirellulaceae bacterium]|nr:LysR substrate-binding domain-containing protein [Pirellulaceae bacterium]